MKRLRIMSIVWMVFMLCGLVLTSCSKDDEDGLAGSYYMVDRSAYFGFSDSRYNGVCYYFENENTVIIYYLVAENKDSYGNPLTRTLTVGGISYYVESSTTYTYTLDDNKIYIPMAGQILTISGNTLSRDGTSDSYVKR